MKTKTMKNKINQLFLTGKAKFRKGDAYCLINEKTQDLMFDCLHHSHDVACVELIKINANHVSITATTKDGDCVLSGIIETY